MTDLAAVQILPAFDFRYHAENVSAQVNSLSEFAEPAVNLDA